MLWLFLKYYFQFLYFKHFLRIKKAVEIISDIYCGPHHGIWWKGLLKMTSHKLTTHQIWCPTSDECEDVNHAHPECDVFSLCTTSEAVVTYWAVSSQKILFPGVNFTNILQAAFLYSVFEAFTQALSFFIYIFFTQFLKLQLIHKTSYANS